MVRNPIVARFYGLPSLIHAHFGPRRPDLHAAWAHPEQLPDFVTQCAPAMRILDLIGSISWSWFPERNLHRNWGQVTIPHAAFSAACLVKLNEGLVSMADLCQYLIEHPAFIWLLGFPLVSSFKYACGFDPSASLPTQRHLTQMLRALPNSSLQFLLDQSVHLLLSEFHSKGLTNVGECISLDTKHILAWVKENNPKAYTENRFDKTRQPKGDPDCKLGCKRRHNRQILPSETATPTNNPIPASQMSVGEYYWGYGSGVIAVKVPEWGEFVLAEMTQTFDKADVSYFFPLMHQVEQRLGFKPRFGTFDAAFDAFYVYDYFHRDDDPQAFAAVPFSEKGGYKAKERQFSPEGLPLCAAGLPMPLQFTYTDRTVTIIEHERGKYICPLRSSPSVCPIHHERWDKGGCTATMPTSIGARLRYTLDRGSQVYKEIHKQRTAAERMNSQAVDLGIERPHIRNGKAIANINTLIYTLINLRLLGRLRQRLPENS
jgi:hypothetical protein